MNMKKRKKTISGQIFDFCNIVVLTLFTLVCIYPFYYVFIYSLSDPRQAALGVYLLPKGFTIFNFTTIFRLSGLARAAFVSVARTVIGTFLTVFCSALFGYVLTKDKLPFKAVIYRFSIITMYMGAGLIPWYLTIKMYGLSNTFLLYVIPSAVGMFDVILIKTFIEQLPASLEESARIDGAGYLTCFVRIIIPLSVPIIATISVFSAVGQWNSYFDNYIFVTNENLRTLQYILFSYMRRAEIVSRDINAMKEAMAQRRSNITPMSVRMSITMVITLPILFVYPFAQRYFVKGILIGAIKG